jgi:hypothetical protein
LFGTSQNLAQPKNLLNNGIFMAKRKQQSYIKGTAKHHRTEGDYMSTLLDTVKLEDWEDVVSSALSLAKQGDAQARAWLAQYLSANRQARHRHL